MPNNEPAAYIYTVSDSSHNLLDTRTNYLHFTDEENNHFQEVLYSEITKVINFENFYQWAPAGKKRVEDKGERNQG